MLRQKIIESDSFKPDYQIIDVEVDYRSTIPEITKEMGAPFAPANLFESTARPLAHLGVQKVRIVLIGHKRMINSDEAKSDMLEHGIKPAGIRELLFIFKTKKWQLHGLDFVALGSRTDIDSIKGEMCVPMYRPETFVVPNQARGIWPCSTRFLGILQTPTS